MSQHSSSGDQPDGALLVSQPGASDDSQSSGEPAAPSPSTDPPADSAPADVAATAAPEVAADSTGEASTELVTEATADPAEAASATEAPAEAPAEQAVDASGEPSPAEVVDPELANLPQSFDELALPDALRQAIAQIGWTRPTPVQALSFGPLYEGQDVLVQSHTGSGKTGAFCIPWMAARFDPRPAAETGVQLLVLLPTRELAKQVCEELRRLAIESPVEVLPIYGGTPMQPQLSALKAGVHAVVGTPGRVLDHIRRRSLDLSKVTTVVLDECDEMLSMGFLEDIRAILDACTGKHLTALFSATIPNDIQRIAKRYMQSPLEIQLSGDMVAAAEIDHAYYIVSGAIKTRDLLDLIVVEEPARAIIFCNTREETKLVASVLRREGYQAEEISSDLTQVAREKVMGMMREHKLRFLVATDVAARGIDITHVSHVINYSFPETAEVYIHRTGRTGRAGRTGTAISLIHARELGNFYYLKLQYETIEFRERYLPPADQLAAQRMEVKLDGISKRFPELVSPEWVLLARNLMADPRGERVIGLLLERAMKVAPQQPQWQAEDGEQPALDSAQGEAGERQALDLSARPYEPREGEGSGRPEYREQRERRPRSDGRRRDSSERPGRFDRRPERDDRGPRSADDRGPRSPEDRPRFDDRGPRSPEDRPARFDDRAPRTEDRAPRLDDRGPRNTDDRAARPDDRGPRTEDRAPRPDDRGPRNTEDRAARPDDRGSRPDDRAPRFDARGPRDDRPRGDARGPRGDARGPRFDDRGPRGDDRRPRRDDDRRPRRDRDDRPRRDLQPGATGEIAPVAETELVPLAPPVPAPLDDLVQGTGETGAPIALQPAEGRRIPIDRRGRRGDRGASIRWPHAEPGVSAATAATETPADLNAAPAPVFKDLVEAPGDAVDQVGAAPVLGDEGDARRKRRRKRRRRRGPGEDTAPGLEAGATPDEDSDEPELAESEQVEAEGATELAAELPGDNGFAPGGRKRRRKRRGRLQDGPRVAPAPVVVAPPPPPTAPIPRRPSQEEIVIDIDEAELEVVTSEFGELDDIDEFALLDRRQAVIETLQEEVELEDLSLRDARSTEGDVEADTEDEDDTDDGTDDSAEVEAEADTAEAAEAPSEEDSETDADGRRRRRRRRRKKQAAFAPPELTAPPHKDFWEVWSSKYSYSDFEDSKVGPPPNLEPEPPPAPVAVVTPRDVTPARPGRHHSQAAPVSRPAPSLVASDVDDSEFTKVLLNLGRVHGHKSSSIRNLLRESLGLEGRSIRDLTVRDVSTLFRVPEAEIARCQGLLTAVRVDNVDLTLERAEDSREDLRAPQPEAIEDAPREQATEIRLDPLEFENVLPQVEDPTS